VASYSYGTASTIVNYGLYGIASGGVSNYALYGWGSGGTNNYGLYVAGGTKSWVNPDPEDPSKAIAYATIESGENETVYRGRARLVNGRALVKLPDHFRKVTSPKYPVTVQVTPRDLDSLGLAVVKSTNAEIEVGELYRGTGNYEFDYVVQGVRLGYEDYNPVINNVDYVPFQGNQASVDKSEYTTQEWYDQQSEGLKRIFIANGTLDKNGKVNEALFKQKGWEVSKTRAPKRDHGQGPQDNQGEE
jgi:hypothetical protein